MNRSENILGAVFFSREGKMYNINVPVKFSSSRGLSHYELGDFVNRFLESYGQNRLKEQNIVLGNKRQVPINLTNPESRRRVMVRIISLIRAEITKEISYLVHSKSAKDVSFISGQEGIRINLYSETFRKFEVNIEYDVSDVFNKKTVNEYIRHIILRGWEGLTPDSPGSMLCLFVHNTLMHSEFRYVKMINRKCREYGLPVLCEVPTFFNRSFSNVNVKEWEDGKGATVTWEGYFGVSLLFRWMFEGARALNTQGYQGSRGPVAFNLLSKKGRSITKTHEEFYVPDINRIGVGPNAVNPPEIMLEEMDSLRRVFKTLSRKFKYERSAFSIGTPKDS